MSAADVLKLIKEKGIKFVDLRLTDTRGKEQQRFRPGPCRRQRVLRGRQDVRRLVDRRLEGHQRLRHDPHARRRARQSSTSSRKEPTLNVRCDVIEPSTMQGYERDPRSAAKRAEAYLKSTGIATRRFSARRTNSSSSTTSAGPPRCAGVLLDRFERGLLAVGQGDLGRQSRPSAGHQGRLLPVPPVDSLNDIRAAMCLALEEMGLVVEGPSPRGRTSGAMRNRRQIRRSRPEGRRCSDAQVRAA